MAVGSVKIALRASRTDGRRVLSSEFLTPLAIQPGEVQGTRADGGAWAASGMVYLGLVRHTDFDHVDTSFDDGAQTEAFLAGCGDALRAAARFLDARAPEVTAAMRAAGISLRLLVEVRIDANRMELEFPPELLAACGRHGLSLSVLASDGAVVE
jgi:hypothetical protein